MNSLNEMNKVSPDNQQHTPIKSIKVIGSFTRLVSEKEYVLNPEQVERLNSHLMDLKAKGL